MLHVIFLLFKIIGIILLVLLGLILTILLVILLIPIRYRIRVNHGEEFQLEGRISWLLHVVHMRISLLGEQRRILLRIFGFALYDSLRPKKRKHKGGKRSRADRSNKGNESDPEEKESREYKPLLKEAITPSKEAIAPPKEERIDPSNIIDNVVNSDPSEKSSLPEQDIPNQDIKEEKIKKEDIKEEDIKEVKEAKESFLTKVLHRIKGICHRIIDKLRSIGKGIKRTFIKLFDLKKKWNLILEFLKDEDNRAAFQVTFLSLKKLLKHILPKRLKSKVTFGTGDPCYTGKALGAMSILYSFYGDNIQITPDFENKIFEGSHYARGRIRIGSLLIIVIKLFVDKKFKQLKRNFKILKEAL